jgi:hypothetical protein
MINLALLLQKIGRALDARKNAAAEVHETTSICKRMRRRNASVTCAEAMPMHTIMVWFTLN